jgi:hypothetical protein
MGALVGVHQVLSLRVISLVFMKLGINERGKYYKI